MTTLRERRVVNNSRKMETRDRSRLVATKTLDVNNMYYTPLGELRVSSFRISSLRISGQFDGSIRACRTWMLDRSYRLSEGFENLKARCEGTLFRVSLRRFLRRSCFQKRYGKTAMGLAMASVAKERDSGEVFKTVLVHRAAISINIERKRERGEGERGAFLFCGIYPFDANVVRADEFLLRLPTAAEAEATPSASFYELP